MKVGRDFFPLIAEGHVPANTGGLVDVTPSFIVPEDEFNGATFIAPAAGVNYSLTVTFAGTYAVGDQITVSVSSNDRSVQKWNKPYRYTVPAGGTAVADIAAAIVAKIQIDAESGMDPAPYTATSAAGVVTITAKNDDSVGISATAWTNSSAGTVVASAASGTISEGQVQDLIDKGIDPSQINLADYDTVRINYVPKTPIGDIDAKVPRAREIYWYGTPGTGANFATLINSL
jgi:hypothetical protein